MEKFVYSAFVTDVYDGDTITCDIDLGFGIFLKEQKFRFWGVDTWELRGSERDRGLLAKEFVVTKILNKFVTIKTHKDKKGKYGRWLCEVFYDSEDNGLINLNVELLSEGHALIYKSDL